MYFLREEFWKCIFEIYFLWEQFSKYFLKCIFWLSSFENAFFEEGIFKIFFGMHFLVEEFWKRIFWGSIKIFWEKKLKKKFFAKKNEKQWGACQNGTICVKNNYFEFNRSLYKQVLCTAIGTKFTTFYVSIFVDPVKLVPWKQRH